MDFVPGVIQFALLPLGFVQHRFEELLVMGNLVLAIGGHAQHIGQHELVAGQVAQDEGHVADALVQQELLRPAQRLDAFADHQAFFAARQGIHDDGGQQIGFAGAGSAFHHGQGAVLHRAQHGPLGRI